MNKKILCMVLAIFMIFGMVPFGSFNNEVKAIDLFDPNNLHWEFPYRCQDDAITFEALKKPIEVEAEKRTLTPIVKPEVMNKVQNGVLFIQMNIYNEQVGNRIIQIPIFKSDARAAYSNTSDISTILYYGDKIDVKYIIKNNIFTYNNNVKLGKSSSDIKSTFDYVTAVWSFGCKHYQKDCELTLAQDDNYKVDVDCRVSKFNYMQNSINLSSFDAFYNATELIGKGFKINTTFNSSFVEYSQKKDGDNYISPSTISDLNATGHRTAQRDNVTYRDGDYALWKKPRVGNSEAYDPKDANIYVSSSEIEGRKSSLVTTITNTTSKNMTIDAYDGNGNKIFNTEIMPGNTYNIPSDKIGKFSRLVTNGQKLGFVEGQPIKPADPYFPDDAIGKAKAEANAKIDALEYLSQEEKDAAKQAVKDAKDETGVKTALDAAIALNDKNKQALDKYKEEAKKTIAGLSNLSQDEIKGYNTEIDAAKDKATVDAVVEKAKAKSEENKKALDGQKQAAKGEIDKLENLTPAEKDGYKKAIDEATNKEAVDKAVEEAKAKDAENKKAKDDADKLKAAQEQAKKDIEALPELTDEQKKAYEDRVDQATTPESVQAIFNEAKGVSDKLVADKAALEKAKTEALAKIDALKNLTEEEKTPFKAKVNAAITPAEANKAYVDAVLADTSKGSLSTARAKALETIGKLENIKPEDKENAIKAVNNAKTIAEVAQALGDAIEKDKAELQVAKDAAKTVINALNNLKPEEKQPFLDRVDAATKIVDVKAIVEEAKAADAKKAKVVEAGDLIDQDPNIKDKDKAKDDLKNKTEAELLEAAKKSAKNIINALTDLPQEDKDAYIAKVDAATTIPEVKAIVKEAVEKDAMLNINKAKELAKKEINALENLTPEEKAEAIAKVDAATTPEEVKKALDEAKAQDALNKAKKDAEKAIDENKAMDPTDKDKAKEDIKNADTEDALKEALDKILAQVKEAAKKVINDTENLTPKEKAAFNDRIDIATTIEEVNQVLADALAKAKENAKAKIDNDPTLDDDKKKDAKDAVDNADNLKDVDKAVEEANKSALDKVKDNAKKIVNDTENLTPAEKEAFVGRIDAATTIDEVNDILKEALDKAKENAKKAIDEIPNVDPKDANEGKDNVDKATTPEEVDKALELAKAKTEARKQINETENLTPEEKKGFIDRIDAAKTVEEVKEILADALAKAKDNAKKAIDENNTLTPEEKDKAKEDVDNATTLPEVDNATKKVNETEELKNAKEEATKAIDALENLSKEEKDAAKKNVNDATTTEEVAKALEDAKNLDELNKAKTDAKAVIEADKNLTDDQKADAEKRIDNAKTVDEVKAIVDEVVNGGQSDADKKALDEAKDAAKSEVDKLDNLTPAEKDGYKKAIDEATNKEAVEKVIEEAKAKNEQNLKDAKEKAEAEIKNMDLTNKQKEEAIDKVNKATNVGEVDKAVEDAKSTAKSNGTTEVIPAPTPNPGTGHYINDFYYGDEDAYTNKPAKEEPKKEEPKKEEVAPAPTPSQAQLNLANVLKWIFKIDSPFLTKMMTRTSEVVTMDVAPFIRNNKTMLPLRYVAQTLGADVQWNAATRTATFTRNGLAASIQIDGNKIVMSDGRTIQMTAKPANVKARIFVPLTDVSKVFGLTNGNVTDGINQNIEWNGTARTVEIYTNR